MSTAELVLALMSPAHNRVTLKGHDGKPVTGHVRSVEIESGSSRSTFCCFNVSLFVENGDIRTIFVRTTG